MARILVTIDPAGQVKMEVQGAQGKACDKVTAPLMKRLGVTTDTQRKPEYYETETHTQLQQ